MSWLELRLDVVNGQQLRMIGTDRVRRGQLLADLGAVDVDLHVRIALHLDAGRSYVAGSSLSTLRK